MQSKQNLSALFARSTLKTEKSSNIIRLKVKFFGEALYAELHLTIK